MPRKQPPQRNKKQQRCEQRQPPLSTDEWSVVLSFLTPLQLLQAERVSRQLLAVARRPYLWEQLWPGVAAHFPGELHAPLDDVRRACLRLDTGLRCVSCCHAEQVDDCAPCSAMVCQTTVKLQFRIKPEEWELRCVHRPNPHNRRTLMYLYPLREVRQCAAQEHGGLLAHQLAQLQRQAKRRIQQLARAEQRRVEAEARHRGRQRGAGARDCAQSAQRDSG